MKERYAKERTKIYIETFKVFNDSVGEFHHPKLIVKNLYSDISINQVASPYEKDILYEQIRLAPFIN